MAPLLLPPVLHWGVVIVATLWLLATAQRLAEHWSTGRTLGAAPPASSAAAGKSASRGGARARAVQLDVRPSSDDMPLASASAEPARAAMRGALLDRLTASHTSSSACTGPAAVAIPPAHVRAHRSLLGRLVSTAAGPAGAATRASSHTLLARAAEPARTPSPRTARAHFLASCETTRTAAARSADVPGAAPGSPHWSAAFSAAGGLARALERWRAPGCDAGLLVLTLEASGPNSLGFARSVAPALGGALLALAPRGDRTKVGVDGGVGCARSSAPFAIAARVHEAVHALVVAAAFTEPATAAGAAGGDALRESSLDFEFARHHFGLGAAPALVLVWGPSAAERVVIRGRQLHRSSALGALVAADARARGTMRARAAEAALGLIAALARFRARPPPQPAESIAARDARLRVERLELLAQQDAEFAAALAADARQAEGATRAEAARGTHGPEAGAEAAASGEVRAAPARAACGDDGAAARAAVEPGSAMDAPVEAPAWWLARQAAGTSAQLGEEPARGKGVLGVVVRMRTGRRVCRRFHVDAPLAKLRAWVEASCASEDDAAEQFALAASFPRRVLGGACGVAPRGQGDGQGTVHAVTIGEALQGAERASSVLLHVEDADEESASLV
ncbi:hypothetical protein KFE25_009620 [Diacronema lutheri]|uniref:UBX domain-containing protein n=3 Tax=Diacronema lutheri TaxID=2081491 RepID=A0A8J5Y602_DIALT|nr:hypothetical protein KFE25_009620 [Diacronema lutheri]